MNVDNDIRKKFQSKFGDYKAPAPADGWDRLERSMRAAKAARVARRRWYAGSAAAILVVLAGSILFLRNPVVQPEQMIAESSSSSSPAAEMTEEKTGVAAEQGVTSPQVTRLTGSKQLFAARAGKIGGESQISGISPSDMMENWLQRARKDDSGTAGRSDSHALRALVSVQHKTTVAERDAEEFITVNGERAGLFGENGSGQMEDGRLILAFNGRGGLNSYHQMVNTPMTLRSATVGDGDQFTGERDKMVLAANSTADNIAEMEHDQPVSFGITVSKSLFDDLYLETGLVYTYLSSKARNTNSNFRVQETQRLHYLGIPLNVNYNLFSLKKLNVYASVGGMLEKDVYGEYRKIGEGQSLEFNSTSEEEEITKISQRNPQLSVNAGVGLSYPVYNSLKLYGKIGGAYYFDANNEYKTIYSDRKIVMDLNVGVRYEF
ncbi:MAG: hypothetical protein GX042_04040 [Bacteroidales bacterium]|jgi:hypothetical protein|nr:hypothetical protein [Bacteroidales bacterium]